MRWIHIDRFLELERDKRAVAIRNVSAAEDHLHDVFPGFPIMPNTLLIESAAQTAGILAGLSVNFERDVFLAKISSARFEGFALPGDQVRIEAKIVELREDEGCRTHCVLTIDDKPLAEIEILFAYVGENQTPNGQKPGTIVFNDSFRQLFAMQGMNLPED